MGAETGPGWRLVLQGLALLLLLPGPALLVLGLLGDDGPLAEGPAWPALVAGLLMTVVLTPFGLVVLAAVRRSRLDHDRLRRSGVPATATVTAVRPTTIGDEPGLDLTLLIAGAGLTTFEATCLVDGTDADLVEGTVLTAVVDPSDGLFDVETGRRNPLL